MSQRGQNLSDRVKSFTDEVVSYVGNISDEDWEKILDYEEWGVGVTARHIGAGHFDILGMTKMIINGDKFPEMTIEQINEMSNQHAREHADCTKGEVLDILKKNGSELADFVAGLSDDELDKEGFMPAMNSNISAQQFIEFVIFDSANEHFENMKKKVGK